MEPMLLNASLASFFAFWHEAGIHEGMTYANEMYRKVKVFNNSDRQRAFDLAWEIGKHGYCGAIVRTENGYSVWTNLRAPWEQSTPSFGELSRAVAS